MVESSVGASRGVAVPPSARDHRRSSPGRVAPLAVAGTAVEWYDFAVYGAMAVVLADVFFPGGSGTGQAVAVFGVFATSFVARPVGALLLGPRADRHGSGPVFAHLVLLMAVATGAIGLLPTTAEIGVLAPILLLLLRLAQGFSAGGQPASALVLLVDAAPPGRRGRFAGWHMSGIATGIAAGIGVAVLVVGLLSPDQLAAWGWRVPFLLAFPLGIVGWALQRRTHGTSRAVPPASGVRSLIASHGAVLRRGFWIIALLTGTFNTWFIFLPGHVAGRQVSLGEALVAAGAGIAVIAVSTPVMGGLADRVGRRPLVLASCGALSLVALPAYALATSGELALLVTADVIVGVALSALVVPVLLVESFPAAQRATGLGLSYGLSSAVFGGTAPLVATVLSAAGSWWVPAYLAALGLLGLGSARALRETAFVPYARARAGVWT